MWETFRHGDDVCVVDVWNRLQQSGVFTLIHDSECAASDVSDVEAAIFASEENGGEVKQDVYSGTFQLTDIPSLPVDGSFRLDEALLPNADLIVLTDYNFDLEWLLGEHPVLLGAKQLLLVHGDGDVAAAANRMVIQNLGLEAQIKMYKPPLPIAYGTHHTKMMMLFYPTGLRLVIHTANMVSGDWNGKTQGAFLRDFPTKRDGDRVKPEFETYLCDYLAHLGGPLPDLIERLGRYNYTDAGVHLVASVPGRHSGKDMHR